MNGVTGMAALGFGLLCACSIASAACDITTYDRTPPPAIRADPATSVLEWATDVDTLRGQHWIWHYVKNTQSQPLGVRWVKADIRRHVTNPLPPGEIDCRRIFANEVADRPDDDAPIIYGTNEQRQDAAVFVKRQTPPGPIRKGETRSIIDTSFADASGKAQNVHVVVATRRTEKGFMFEIEQSPNVVVAISSLSFNSEQIGALSRGLEMTVVPADFQEFTKLDAVKALSGLYSEKELPQRLKQNYVFFPQAKKSAAVEILASSVQEVSADLIILDQRLQPQFATEIQVMVPAAL
jgi:hypothetical protein